MFIVVRIRSYIGKEILLLIRQTWNDACARVTMIVTRPLLDWDS